MHFLKTIAVFLITEIIPCNFTDWEIQVCLSGRTYNISKSSCASTSTSSIGVWFSEPIRIDRACFSHGVWAVYKEWCEPTTLWTVGMNSKTPGCMERNLLEKVSGIVFLGKETGGVTVASSNQRLFFGSLDTVVKESLTLIVPELNVISWGPAAVPYILRQAEISSEGNTNSGPTFETCLMGGSSFFKQYKFNASITRNLGLSLTEGNCTSGTLKSLKPWNEKVLPLPQARADLSVVHSSVHLSNKQSSLDCRDLRTYFKSCDRTKSALDVVQDVDEQSARLALKFQGHVFKNLPLPEHNLQQWEFMEMGKKLLGIACPNQILPTFFLEKITVLAQYLFSESVRTYPRPAMDPNTFIRIQNVLHTCTNSAKPFKFEAKDVCSNNVFIQVKYLNATTGFAPIDLPEDIKNNVGAYDLIIEATWKIFLFAHYTCAKYFNQFSSDLSVFYSVWLEMITRDLQERWTNPGKSFQLMQIIFKGIDLIRTVKNLDYCVGAAHAQSVYNEWLKRPFQVHGNRKLIVTKDLIWGGNAYCMDTYAFPSLRLGYPINKCGVTYGHE